jgi:hypothetical protein
MAAGQFRAVEAAVADGPRSGYKGIMDSLHPSQQDVGRPLPTSRWPLLVSLACSVALHTLVVVVTSMTKPTQHTQTPPPPPLLAKLRATTSTNVTTVPEPPVGETLTEQLPQSAAEPSQPSDLKLTRQARFAIPPDLHPLETVPLIGSTRLRLRLHVSALGTLTRIEILETQRVSGEFLATVYQQLEAARYTQALAGPQAVSGTFEILIEAQPELDGIDQSPLGKAKVTDSE